MLSVQAPGSVRTCAGTTRRELLQIGTCGIGGLTLPSLLALPARGASGNPIVRDKCVVVLNLQGGATHIETFDPKMTAPVEIRAMFGEVQTRLPGVTFGSHFGRLAQMADRMSVVRSFRHGNSSHEPAAKLVMAGGHPAGGNMGSLYARLGGLTNPKTGIPNCTLIAPSAAGEEYKALNGNVQRVTELGTLPPTFKPFDPSAGGEILGNMKMKLDPQRFDDRRHLLSQLDEVKREAERSADTAAADRFQQQAFDVILGGIGEAFDLSRERAETIARYDTRGFDIPPAYYKKKNNNLKGQSPIALGKQMLLARRLVEAGCRFVTVTSAGWDMHGNAFGIDDGMPLLGAAVDKAASAFLEDIEQRGLSDRVLLVITGEFGRTPKINNKAGRDHWGNLCTLAFAGGGLPAGQVVGQSDRTASVPQTEPLGPQHLLATIMHVLFDMAELRITQGVPNDLLKPLVDAPPIPQLVASRASA